MRAVWEHLSTASDGSKIGCVLITGDKIGHIIIDMRRKIFTDLVDGFQMKWRKLRRRSSFCLLDVAPPLH